VPEKELVKLLETGALPWSTLVWHRALADWKPVLETELAKIVGPGVPPPLPAGTRKAGQRATKNPVCPTCGSTSKAGDRFCAACGQPLSS
jgi:hypothetical protein